MAWSTTVCHCPASINCFHSPSPLLLATLEVGDRVVWSVSIRPTHISIGLASVLVVASAALAALVVSTGFRSVVVIVLRLYRCVITSRDAVCVGPPVVAVTCLLFASVSGAVGAVGAALAAPELYCLVRSLYAMGIDLSGMVALPVYVSLDVIATTGHVVGGTSSGASGALGVSRANVVIPSVLGSSSIGAGCVCSAEDGDEWLAGSPVVRVVSLVDCRSSGTAVSVIALAVVVISTEVAVSLASILVGTLAGVIGAASVSGVGALSVTIPTSFG